MFVFSIHLHLIEHYSFGFKSIAWPDVFQSIEDLLAIRVLLVTELIGREGQDDKIRELFTQLVHLREVPDGRASERRSVLDEDRLPLVLRHGHHFAR